MNRNWSATKQRLHPQSVAEISRHLVLSGTGFDNVEHHLGFVTRTQISVTQHFEFTEGNWKRNHSIDSIPLTGTISGVI